MGVFANISRKAKEITSSSRVLRTAVSWVVYLTAIGFLSLLDWAEFTVDLSRLTDPSYWWLVVLRSSGFTIILGNTSVNRIADKKLLDPIFTQAKKDIRFIINRHRYNILEEFVFMWNEKELKKASVRKWSTEKAKLERKHKRDWRFARAWKHYSGSDVPAIEVATKVVLVDTPKTKKTTKLINKITAYLENKKMLNEKLDNPTQYMHSEETYFEQLYEDDLIIEVGSDPDKKIPREKEATALSRGILFYMFRLVAFSAISASIFLERSDDWFNSMVAMCITVLLAFLSVFWGIVNGEGVFETNTMKKANFVLNHLQAYAIFEKTKYGYNIFDKEKE